ncbi:MAG: AsmA family protein, partial [Alphaproteobacteria bacterium]|nr:AsmA family protein [Alphaproteobacteria bacterium]
MKIVYSIIALLVVVVAALFIAPAVINWDSYKPDITAQIEAATGRKLWIDGDIDVTLLPSPRLRVNDVRLANMAGATSADMARLKSLQLHLALGPLITGEIQVTSLTLVDPVIELERLEDGRANWQFEPVATEDGGADEGGVDAGAASDGDAGVRLDDVVLRNGTLIWRDHATGKTEYVQRINADLTATSLDGPFQAEGSFVARDIAARFVVHAGEIRVGRPMRATASLDIGKGLLTGEFEGVVDDPRGTEPRLRGDLSARGDNFAALLAALSNAAVDGEVANGGATPALTRPFALEAQAALTSRSLGLDEVRFTVGDVQASGRLDWLAGPVNAAGRVDAAFGLRGLDLDVFYAAGSAGDAKIDPGTGARSGGWPAGAPDPAPAFARGPLPIEAALGALLTDMPASLSGGAEITADAVRYRGGIIRQVRAVLALDEGVLTVEQAGALMPGAADAALFGQLSPAAGGLAFDGRVEFVADDLRAAMRWLDVEPLDVPADRLRRASGSAALVLSPTRIALQGADLRIDASRLAGDIAIDRVGRPRILTRLSLDRLNWDAYQPRAAPVTGRVVAESVAGSGAPVDATEEAPTLPATQLLAVLPGADVDIELTIGALVRSGVAWEEVALAGRLEDGDLTIRRASVKRAAGARFDLSGAIANVAAAPVVDLTLTGDADSLAPLLRALEVKTDIKPQAIGGVGLTASLRGDEAALSITVETTSAVGNIALFGTIERPMGKPAIALGLRLRADDAGRFVQAMGFDAPAAVQRLGALAVDGGLDGDLGNLQVNLGVEAADALLQLAGTVTSADTAAPIYDLNIDLGAEDASALLRAVAGDNAHTAAGGALKVRTRIEGDARQARVSGFDATLGSNSLRGSGDVVLDDPLPVIKAKFEADEFDLAALIGGAAAASPEDTRGGNEAASGASGRQTVVRGGDNGRWSTEPINLAVLDEVTADIRLRAQAFIVSGYRFEQAELDIAIADGTLDIYSLRGRIFDGLFEAEGRIANSAPPGATLSFKLAGADMEMLLMQTGGIDAVSGAITLDGRLATQGANEAELVRGLGGEVHLAGGNGVIRGVDIGQVSAQLSALDDAGAFAGLAHSGLSGGETPLHDISGVIGISQGIATTEDTTV